LHASNVLGKVWYYWYTCVFWILFSWYTTY